jgi:hypothetical protein
MDQSRAAPLRAFDKERTGTRGPIVGGKPLGVERSRSDGTTSGSPPARGKQALSVLFALALIGLHCRASAASVETIDGLAAAQIVSNAPFDNQLKAISAIGLHRARLGLRWSETKKVRGRFDWSLADRKMADMRRRVVTPIVTLFGGNKAIRTAAADGSGPPAHGEALAGFAHTVLVHNLSSDGLQLETTLDLASGAEMSIGLPGVGTRAVRVVRRDGTLYGCSFVTPVPPKLLAQPFATSSVIEVSFARLLPDPIPEPYVRKWHPAVRVALMLSLGIAVWALILHISAA